MLDRSPHHPTAADDNSGGQPTQSGFHKWFVGGAVPFFFAGVGVYAIAMQTITYGNQTPLTLHGTNATMLGISLLAIALFLHCHSFGGNV